MEDRELTFGEKMVRVDFNPSADVLVNQIKKAYALVIDSLDALRNFNEPGGEEIKRLCSVAITQAEGACMWAVKAITCK